GDDVERTRRALSVELVNGAAAGRPEHGGRADASRCMVRPGRIDLAADVPYDPDPPLGRRRDAHVLRIRRLEDELGLGRGDAPAGGRFERRMALAVAEEDAGCADASRDRRAADGLQEVLAAQGSWRQLAAALGIA